MSERQILQKIQLAATKLGARIFRNNTAMAWAGKLERGPASVTLGPGDIVLRNARPIHAGLCKGGSDLIGWTPVKITGEHVGKTLAIFTAVEVKTEGVRVTPEQSAFLHTINDGGGIAILARSDGAAIDELRAYVEGVGK